MATNTKALLNGGIPAASPSTKPVTGVPTSAGAAIRTAERIDSLVLGSRAIKAKLDEIAKVLKGRPVTIPFIGDRYLLSWIPAVLGIPNLSKAQVEGHRGALLAAQRKNEAELQRLRGVLDAQRKAITGNKGKPAGGGTTTPTKPDKKGSPYSKTITYNASSVKEAYFYTEASAASLRKNGEFWSGNTPAKVEDANKLWKDTLTTSSKGIIQTWNPPGGLSGFIKDGNWASVTQTKSIQRYGFQFLYNPTTISMAYGGVADVDPGQQSSGTEQYLLANPQVFQSTVNIEVIINRMHDMKHLTASGLKSGQITDFYTGNLPDKKALKAIYEKGTMYDVEFLLQTMFPWEPYKSQLRGKTSDVGYLGASPVELHLGNKLRYVAQINGISVNHVIFDDRMVPLFTTVTISTNRIPDYQGIKNDTGGGGDGGGGGTTNLTRPPGIPQGADAAERWLNGR